MNTLTAAQRKELWNAIERGDILSPYLEMALNTIDELEARLEELLWVDLEEW